MSNGFFQPTRSNQILSCCIDQSLGFEGQDASSRCSSSLCCFCCFCCRIVALRVQSSSGAELRNNVTPVATQTTAAKPSKRVRECELTALSIGVITIQVAQPNPTSWRKPMVAKCVTFPAPLGNKQMGCVGGWVGHLPRPRNVMERGKTR